MTWARVRPALEAALCAAAVTASLGAGPAPQASARPGIDWGTLRNPVLSYPDRSVKDFAAVYRAEDQAFYLFFSDFSGEPTSCRVVEVTTRDFKTFSEPLMTLDGACSPAVARLGGDYVLTFNTWGDAPGRPNQLFYRSSADLRGWGPVRPLAPDITQGVRAIDAALAAANGRIYLVWKERQRPRLAVGASLEGPFTLLAHNDSYPSFQAGLFGRTVGFENFQFLLLRGRWHMLATRMNGHRPFLFRMGGGGGRDEDWLNWADGLELRLAPEAFNSGERANAAALLDLSDQDGSFYLLYAGSPRGTGDEYAGRGWNQLGMSRASDPLHGPWLPAGSRVPERHAVRPDRAFDPARLAAPWAAQAGADNTPSYHAEVTDAKEAGR
ncbi:MAG: hypothetical protein HY928_16145 [Elusimicrobia bacterium]|nr:hypothetical protein [Elusimicrobiota bacterium]